MLGNIPLCEHITRCLSIHHLVDISVVPILWLTCLNTDSSLPRMTAAAHTPQQCTQVSVSTETAPTLCFPLSGFSQLLRSVKGYFVVLLFISLVAKDLQYLPKCLLAFWSSSEFCYMSVLYCLKS